MGAATFENEARRNEARVARRRLRRWCGPPVGGVMDAGGVAGEWLYIPLDFDSCVDGCDVAVEGEITKVVDEPARVVEVRVDRVYRAGDAAVKEKDVLSVTVSLYSKAEGKKLDVGDKL